MSRSQKDIEEIKFIQEVRERLRQNRENKELREAATRFNQVSNQSKYSYNFRWFGRPIIQYPQDIVATQELVFATRPDLIIETGVARGGSLVFYASLLALMDLAKCNGEVGTGGAKQHAHGRVVGVESDLREHNKKELTAHPMWPWIQIIEGSSTDKETIIEVCEVAKDFSNIMVCLDSNHTHDHVLAELRAYAPLVSIGCYCIVFDTIIEELSGNTYPDRLWSPANNPKTAVHQFLRENPNFELDQQVQDKLQITVCPDGYLRRVR